MNVLVIAGLDPSGGAGLVADVRVCEQHGARPVAVATALTEQTTVGVRAANVVAAETVGDQLRAILTDVEVDAVKIGMLGSLAIVEQVARALELTTARVVWDPVGHSTGGHVALFEGDLREAAALLAPHVTIVTPNADEAVVLGAAAIATRDDAIAAGRVIAARGFAAVLVKGGHWGDDATDVLIAGDAIALLDGARLATDGPVHGTGCALATAIACNLGAGQELEAACRNAKRYVAARIAAAVRPGRGRAAVL